jgi:hypothetical protein
MTVIELRPQLRLVPPPAAPIHEDDQWDEFWGAVASAATVAFDKFVSPDHPEIELIQRVVQDARVAAGLPATRESA